MHLRELKDKSIKELVNLAESMGLENVARLRKQDIIFAILKAHAKGGENIFGGGVLEILQDGFGFLRSSEASYLCISKPNSPFQHAYWRFYFRAYSST